MFNLGRGQIVVILVAGIGAAIWVSRPRDGVQRQEKSRAGAQQALPVAESAPGGGPKLLIAPFKQEQARSARKAWAQFLQIEEERTNSIGMRFVLIPAGEFQMGSSTDDFDDVVQFAPTFKAESAVDEQPQHRVRITRPFYLALFEVTKENFRRFVEAGGYKTDAEKDRKGGWGYTGPKDNPFAQRQNFTWRDWGVQQSDKCPVVNVSHNDATAFCEWLSAKEGKKYRLPTEAQWEYACRAGTTSLYYVGDDPGDLTTIGNVADAAAKAKFPQWTAVTSSDGYAFICDVGQFRPNNFGLYDMTGNVWEWCSDWYDGLYYRNSPVSDPPGSDMGTSRVRRGGGWLSSAASCRSASRWANEPRDRVYNLGFRVVLNASPRS